MHTVTKVVGIDGAKTKWVAVELEDGAFADCAVYATLAEIVAAHPDALAFGIDVPIGFPEGDSRPADLEARAFVGARRSSVFPMPHREVLQADTYAEANAVSRKLYSKGISRQTYALRLNIFEADALAADSRVFEVHPEVSFRAMKGDVLPFAKKSWNGLRERVVLLAEAGIRLPETLPCGHVGADDIVDAAAGAWSAARVAAGTALALPSASEGDPRRGRIWA